MNSETSSGEKITALEFMFNRGYFDMKLMQEEKPDGYYTLVYDINFLAMLVMMNFLSIGLSLSSQNFKTLKEKYKMVNKVFYYQLLVQLVVGCVIFGARLFLYLNHDQVFRKEAPIEPEHKTVTKIDFADALVGWELPLALAIGLTVVGVVQYLAQRKINKVYKKDQMTLEIMFETRLGMWSPK